MPSFTDQTGRTITLLRPPVRIVSLVPSQTELLFDLGLHDEVVGITKFCIRPPDWFYSKTRVGGTKKLNPGIIRELQPDLIIANKEENVKEQVEQLALEFPVWISDVNDLAGAFDMIHQVGEMTGRMEEASAILHSIKSAFDRYTPPGNEPAAVYLIWNDPMMTVGAGTFIHAMMKCAGFQNLFADQVRYPPTSIEEICARNCKLLLLSSEPFPFARKHAAQIQRQLLELGTDDCRILLVDGEMFSWYGSRLRYAPAYFEKLWSKIQLPE